MTTKAQPSIEDYYDELTTDWVELSDVLKTYEGLSEFCVNQEFRDYSMSLLASIHHVDSIVLDFLKEPATERVIGTHEYHATLKEIHKMEIEYSSWEFMNFLRESCLERKELEKNKRDQGPATAQSGFDGEILVLETSLNKYLKHVDKRVRNMGDHIHRIHPDRFSLEMLVNYSSY